MKRLLRKSTILFSSGCLGGIVNSLVVWIFGAKGITAALGVKIAPDLTATWLYPRMVWGGIWGFLFLLPLLRKSIYWQGLLYSLGPTLVQLFVVFPANAGKGIMGLELGGFTPLFVVFFNAVWGVSTAMWLRLVKE
ncbi:MAG: hypothetical protein JJE15_13630 [Desulfobacteraceae bacterium]|nr:hypothetical protein [Desulfobacteraceae bacterium]